MLTHFNLIAILLATLAFMISGSLLYNPIHAWGRFWAKESGMLNKESHHMSAGNVVFTFGGTAVGGLLLAFTLGQVTYWFNKFDHDGWMMTSLQVAWTKQKTDWSAFIEWCNRVSHYGNHHWLVSSGRLTS